MYYTIYKITNKINGKIYIGQHRTKKLDDGYMGSGKYLGQAKEKHGIENFEKEILFVFDNYEEMNAKEEELVTLEFCMQEDNYNLCKGGYGDGFGYVNRNCLSPVNDGSERHRERMRRSGKNNIHKLLEKYKDPIFKEKWKESQRKRFENGGKGSFTGKTHTEEWKQKHSEVMKEKQSGEKNSQFGSMWITNEIENKKIKKEDSIPDGWRKGRISRGIATWSKQLDCKSSPGTVNTEVQIHPRGTKYAPIVKWYNIGFVTRRSQFDSE